MKEITWKNTIQLASYGELDETDRLLVDEAKKATGRSYAPYSNFQVGAAVCLDDGTVITGNNQENAAYTNGICAERNALFAAQGVYPDIPVRSIAIAAYTNGEFTDAPITPCGACRQVMVEVESRFKKPLRILLYGKKGTYIIPDGIKVLMPLQFDPSALDNL